MLVLSSIMVPCVMPGIPVLALLPVHITDVEADVVGNEMALFGCAAAMPFTLPLYMPTTMAADDDGA